VTYYHPQPSDWLKYNLEAHAGGALCLAPMPSTRRVQVYTKVWTKCDIYSIF
jgi:hypothetical protein